MRRQRARRHLGPLRAGRAKCSSLEILARKGDEFIPRSAEVNPYISGRYAKSQFTCCDSALLGLVPAFDLLFTRDCSLPVWMRFKPHQDSRPGALCVGGASARRMVVDALGEIVCETDVAGTVDAEEHVGTPTQRKNQRRALRLASLAQGKISSSEILVR